MNITSTLFLFLFFTVVFLLYYLVGNRKFKNIVLLVASLFFYAWGDIKGISLLLIVVLFNWSIAKFSYKNSSVKIQKFFLIFSVTINVLILAYYKYLIFLLTIFSIDINNIFLESFSITLPLGISFFIFKVISFQIDSYRNKDLIEGSIFDFALYVSFFPQILSGPITRYGSMKEQLQNRKSSFEMCSDGAERIVVGMSKKILIAEQVAAIANYAYSLPTPSASIAWLGSVAYTLQIYFDFSGYSDMAIGLGMMFGFQTVENFNYPYIANSVQNFWRRWHISLSTWFRDYVYFSLGGSRGTLIRTSINIFIVFALTGLWHGANWTFVIWGLYYAFFLVLERIVLKNILNKIPSFISWFYTFMVVNIGWIFFRSANLSSAFNYLESLFGDFSNYYLDILQILTLERFIALLFGFIFMFPVGKFLRYKINDKAPFLYYSSLLVLFVVSICYLTGSDFSPFLYVQF